MALALDHGIDQVPKTFAATAFELLLGFCPYEISEWLHLIRDSRSNYRSLLAESPFQNGHHAYEIALPGCGDPQCRYLGTDV
jgi:hypothetical protein